MGVSFLVTTQNNYNVASTKYLQMSEARSHTTARQHTLKQGKFVGSTYSASLTLRGSRADASGRKTDDEPSLSQSREPDPLESIENRQNTIVITSYHQYRSASSARQGCKCHHKTAASCCSLHGTLDVSRRKMPKITEIHSTLDPFLRLPLETSTDEQSLMQFYLHTGRHQLMGATVVSAICPSLDIAQAIMQICPSYPLAHIIIGELMLSRMTQRPVRKFFYSRLSQMYRLIRELLSDPDASPYRKLWTLVQASMLENTLMRFDLQALHTTAMDDLLESHGGIASWQAKESDDGPWAKVVSRAYTSHLARASISIISATRFAIMRDRFVQTMQDIHQWTQLPDEWIFADDSSAVEGQNTDHVNLEWLATYLHLLESQQLSSSIDPVLAPKCEDLLAIILALVLTFEECNLDVTAARRFLVLTQSYLRGTTKPSTMNETTFASLNSVTVAYNISCARCKAFPDPTYGREMRISQSIVDARMVLNMLSAAASDVSATIIAWLFAILRAVIRTKSGDMHSELQPLVFDGDQLRELKLGLEESWKRRTEEAGFCRDSHGSSVRIEPIEPET